jgi:hypothetical protein
MLATVLGTLAAGVYIIRARSLEIRREALEIELPRLSKSSWLNTSPDATFVGVAACAECHADENRSYLETAHSRALAEVDPDSEPHDTAFVHRMSGRSYEVYRQGDRLRHRETAKDDDGHFWVTADFPISYLIGSGRHTRSYLVEDAGFLMESPLTWYASRQRWGLSPGFDRPDHWGFERPADIGCLACHVGNVDSPDDVYQNVTIREQAIGCERCHGPGSLHVADQRAKTDQPSPSRNTQLATIVQPARLTRALAEAICAQCHLRGDATIFVRGRGLADFRPGLPLTDFRVDYHLDMSDSQMKVVGHVDQMRQSRCYQTSESLTCTTCHDPHSALPANERRSHYVEVCRQCHSDDNCRLALADRARQNAENDCVACHMPQVATDIPHVAFTHHHIGVHADATPPAPRDRIGVLVPFDDISHLSEIDRDRNLGLAYLEFAEKQRTTAARESYRLQARALLNAVRRQGLSDPETTAALARMAWEEDPRTALSLASEALQSPRLSPRSRVNTLFVVGDSAYRSNRIQAAVEALEQLVTLRRHSEDWLLLGLCRQRTGELHAAQRALERAASIAPFRPDIHEALGSLHEGLADAIAAGRERALAKRLSLFAH